MKKTLTAHKFGGSSLASAELYKKVAGLIKEYPQAIITVSASGKTTQQLRDLIAQARSGKHYDEQQCLVRRHHLQLCQSLFNEIPEFLNQALLELKNDLQQLQTQFTEEVEAKILAFGERCSAQILTQTLTNSIYLDASDFLRVNTLGETQKIDWQASEALLKKLNYKKNYIVLPGFIARNLKEELITLGPNSSDFSGAIFARLFQANNLTIWTDVSGIMSADPRIIPDAFVIPELTYNEALELAYFGSSVIHPKALIPLRALKLPILIKNTQHPGDKGTTIQAECTSKQTRIKGITGIHDIALVNVEGNGMVGVCGTAAKVFGLLANAKISAILISQASSEHSICFAINETHKQAAKQVLEQGLAAEIDANFIDKIRIETGHAICAIVGEAMVGHTGTAQAACYALAIANVNIHAIAQGSSELNISFVIKQSQLRAAIHSLHQHFYLAKKTVNLGLIGPGQVGKTFLKQLNQQLTHLNDKHNIIVNLLGVMNSKKMLLSQDKHPLNLSSWNDDFNNSKQNADIPAFTKHISSHPSSFNVIIDTTANQKIADHYCDFFDKHLHIITANKRANSSSQQYYQQLRTHCQQHNKKFLYETNVAAGLPVISTIKNLMRTGDTIHNIQAVLSGSLSFIFNQVNQGKGFVEAVLLAKQQAYTEPDPREDLNGMDVARKAICLAREMGQQIELSQLNIPSLVPAALENVSVDDFVKQLPQHEAEIQNKLKALMENGNKVHYLANITDAGIKLGMQSLTAAHPIAQLNGTDNIIVIHSNYYTQPLIIQGPGAGLDVTAQGVLIDLLRLVEKD